MGTAIHRRQFLLVGAAEAQALAPLVIRVHIMFDQGAHQGRGLSASERAKFSRYQENARREFAVSGLLFDVCTIKGAYLRTQGYSEIPGQFLALGRINVFVTHTLRYDVDRDRTGGASQGPFPSRRGLAGSRVYKTFLGLQESGENTLAHEYAHHFTLDTAGNSTIRGNSWADLRNDYWLWRQRRGTPIIDFRACASSEWAK